MAKMCRVCMGMSGAFTNIFDETQNWDTRIADMISECTGYVVRRGDSLPEYICPPCLEDAVSAFNLKRTCEQSHKLYFTLMEEEDREEDICDNPEDDDWEPSGSESERSNHCETGAQIHQNDTDKTDHLERPYKCPYCPKTYKAMKSLRNHSRTHTAERPYKCTFCSRSYFKNCNLEEHIRTHTGDRPFKCFYCSKSYKRRSHLLEHSRIHTGVRPFKCSQCSMSFVYQYKLKRHIKYHTTELPFKCTHCSQSYRENAQLLEHVCTHAGKRTYPCAHCSKSFHRESSLQVHMYCHTGGHPYKCTHCFKTFRYKNKTYKKHIESHTSNVKG